MAPLRATYAALNTLLSGLSYPFGSGNGSTTFTLPDLQARSLVGMGSGAHADANALGDSDGRDKTLRAQKEQVNVSMSGTTNTVAAHTHGAGSYQISIPGELSAPAGANGGADGTYPVTGTSAADGAHQHTFSGSGAGLLAGAYLVAGVYAVKV